MITKEDLLSDGWSITSDPFSSVERDLSKAQDMSIGLRYGQGAMHTGFMLFTPDGTLNIAPDSMADLKIFEKMVLGWEPRY